jgi:hypothetical protein
MKQRKNGGKSGKRTAGAKQTGRGLSAGQIRQAVEKALAETAVVDLHTHLYPPSFGTPVANASGRTDPAGLMLWGIDELVTYHYLVAEMFRVASPDAMTPERFWKLDKETQADFTWKSLFVDRSPVSEACRGVITSLTRLGLDPNVRDLAPLRRNFRSLDPEKYTHKVMETANVRTITMTNDVFDDNERARWERGIPADSRFPAVLRIDPMVGAWPAAAKKMSAAGFNADEAPNERTVMEARRFLEFWLDRLDAKYIAMSLDPSFRFPAVSADPAVLAGERILREAILPACAERNLPLALMIGSRRGINPAIRLAGDMVGRSDIDSVLALCREFPRNKFMVTMLARENQHELAVGARKFANLMVFGCWWFLNNPSLIAETTRMRIELLGTSFVPQHSDARVLEQLVYKWEHSRKVLGEVLEEKYTDLARAGWRVTAEEIWKNVEGYLGGNYSDFLAR